jgi:hypothetical protein
VRTDAQLTCVDHLAQLFGQQLACHPVGGEEVDGEFLRMVDASVGGVALELAQASGNRHTQARAYSALTAINLENGRADQALLYASKGVQLREVPEAQHAWMQIRKGWALAHVRGQQNMARDEIEIVRGILTDLPARDADHVVPAFTNQGESWSLLQGTDPISSVEVADITGTIGLSLIDLGVYGEAQAAFDECIRGIAHASPALAAFFLTQQIKAALTATQLPFAADRMLALAHVTPQINSPRVDVCVAEVLALSHKWNAVSSIHNARDQLKTVANPIART